MIKLVILYLTCLLLVQCDRSSNNLVIIPLNPYSKYSKVGNSKEAYKYYLVKGYIPNSENQLQEVKAFALKNRDSNFSSFNNYQIVFYKESKLTNEGYKEDESDLIEWHGNDIILTFNWSKGNLISIFQYNEGKIVNKADLKEQIKKDDK